MTSCHPRRPAIAMGGTGGCGSTVTAAAPATGVLPRPAGSQGVLGVPAAALLRSFGLCLIPPQPKHPGNVGGGCQGGVTWQTRGRPLTDGFRRRGFGRRRRLSKHAEDGEEGGHAGETSGRAGGTRGGGRAGGIAFHGRRQVGHRGPGANTCHARADESGYLCLRWLPRSGLYKGVSEPFLQRGIVLIKGDCVTFPDRFVKVLFEGS